MEIYVIADTHGLRVMFMRIRWHQRLRSYNLDARVKQFNRDKGTDKLELSDETNLGLRDSVQQI